MEIKVLSFWGCETNPFANPEAAGDGGGYSQPYGGCLLQLPDGREIVVEMDDNSCGDFGTRVGWDVSDLSTGLNWHWWEGSMDDACIDPEEYVDNVYRSMYSHLGAAEELLQVAEEAVHYAYIYLGLVDVWE